MNDLSVSVSSANGPVPQVALPDAAPKVTARGLNFYYGEHHALKNINLEIPEKRVTARSKLPQKKCTGLTLPMNRARNTFMTRSACSSTRQNRCA